MSVTVATLHPTTRTVWSDKDGMNYWCSSAFFRWCAETIIFCAHNLNFACDRDEGARVWKKDKAQPLILTAPTCRYVFFFVAPFERTSWFSSGPTVSFVRSRICTWRISWRTHEVAGSFRLMLSWFVWRRLDSKLKSDRAATYTWMFLQSLWWVELELVYIFGIKMA